MTSMQRPSNTTIIFLTAGCFLAFFVFGFTDNLKGVTLPAMLTEMRINPGVGGNVFFGEYFGFIIATLITGILADKFGLKIVIILAGISMFLGVGGYSSFTSTWLLSASLFVLGLGLGALELGPNAIIVSLHHKRKGLYLNLMAVLHGLGSMIAPLVAGALLSISISWRSIYRWDLFLIAAFVLVFVFLRFPHSEEKATLDFREIPRVAFKGQMPWFYAAISFYVAAEIGMASWLVTFLQEAHGFSVTASSQALSFFFAMLMVGRLLGGFVVHRIGYLRSILFASIGALVCLTVGLFGPGNLSFLLPATGLFFSIIFPTITAAVSDAPTENINTVLGVLYTFAGIGALIGPWMIGWGIDLLGLHTGFAINLAMTLLTLISIYVLWKGRPHVAAA
jgi:FHS family glucose/mannose:H+ symporter-like MFS transporter